MSIIPSRNKVVVIDDTGDMDFAAWPTGQLPYKAEDGTIQGSGLRMLSSGSLLAPVGFSVESGSIDFGDVLRLAESAGFLAFDNLIENTRFQLLDYAVPRDTPSSKPFYFKLIEAEHRVGSVDGNSTVTINPVSFDYQTKLTARTNAMIFKCTSVMENVRVKIIDKKSGVAVKYFPSKSAWVTGEDGSRLEVGENILDFQDTSVIFQAGTDVSFEIQADNVALFGTNGVPAFAALVQQGVFVGVADANDIKTLQDQLTELSEANTVNYEDLNGIPATFTPSPHTHPISDIEGLNDTLSALEDVIEAANSDLDELATVASTGSYNDLRDKPTIPVVNYPVKTVNSKTGDVVLTASDVGAIGKSDGIPYSQITNTPTIPQAVTNVSQLVNDAGYISSVTFPVTTVNGKTGNITLSASDIGAASVNHGHVIADVSGLQAQLDSKASATTLSGYATTTALTSGLSAKFNTPTGTTFQYIRGDGTLATFPTIPVTSVNGKTGSVVLTSTDLNASPIGHTHVISEVAGLQASLDSKAATESLNGYATTSALTSGLSAKFNTPSGTTSQYVRGDGSLAILPTQVAQVNSDWNATSGPAQILNKPTIPTVSYPVTSVNSKTGAVTLTAADVGAATPASVASALSGMRKVETFLANSDASGNLTITFANTYTTPPDVQPQLIGNTFNQMVRVVSVSNTGCVLQTAQRNLVTLLGLEVLLGATVAYPNATVTVQVTPRN